jgi:hypothetical protein
MRLCANLASLGVKGMVDIAGLHHQDRAALRFIVQVAGEALKIPVPVLRDAMDRSLGLREILLNYAHNFLVQVAATPSWWR